jgi:hypothetical protein
MVVSYKIKQTKDNEVARSKDSGSITNSKPTKASPTMVADEFPTPQVNNVQLCETFRGNERGTGNYNELYHLNRAAIEMELMYRVQFGMFFHLEEIDVCR